jgi:transposase-like protein
MGCMTVAMPRAWMADGEVRLRGFTSPLLPRHQRPTPAGLSLIAIAHLAGVNTRRVRRALGGLFGGAVSKDTVSRAWRKVQTDFAAWSQRALPDEPTALDRAAWTSR